MNFIQRFMYGRYGMDQLNIALLLVYLVLYLISGLFRSHTLRLLSFLCLITVTVRFFSRRADQRREENARFLNAVGPLLRRYNVNKSRRQDKDHSYFKCPNCGQQLRVPKGKGKISITCRSCGASFEEKT
ncbi:MAG: hypothetical protein HFF04_07375 [Oscillospiraceae bacterium]|nr:hypothetical protein [Oscillospiraceae bacterium]